MILHVLTACSRPQLLDRLARALAPAEWHGIDLRWHLAFDLAQRHEGGQALKNRMLDDLAGASGYVWICDDDNLPHPDFFRRLPALLADGGPGVLVAQQRFQPDRVAPPVPAVGQIDAAQIVVAVQAIGMVRLPETYAGDGAWIERLAQQLSLIRTDEILCYYNAQRHL